MTEAVQERANGMTDAARIFFTSKTTWALLLGAIALGMWVENTRSQAVAAVSASQELAASIEGMRSDLSEMRGALSVLPEMRTELSRIKADISRLENQDVAFETRIQTQDSWIQTTRDRLNRQGFDAPSFNPGQNE